MKILYVDTFGDGGHGHAYRYAMTNEDKENIYILPCNVKDITGKIYIKLCPSFLQSLKKYTGLKLLAEYVRWLRQYL